MNKLLYFLHLINFSGDSRIPFSPPFKGDSLGWNWVDKVQIPPTFQLPEIPELSSVQTKTLMTLQESSRSHPFVGSYTPLKINMEPENTPLEEENHLPNIIFRFYVHLRGCKDPYFHGDYD